MCGRYTLKDAEDFLEAVFKIFNIPRINPRYNIAPTQNVLSVLQKEGNTTVKDLRWGLIPSWAKDKSMSARMINSRSETITEKPSFKKPFKEQRCLILADGFYEWQKSNGQKQPFYIKMKDDKTFAFAGIFDRWIFKDEIIDSCSIITTVANNLMAEIHDRMPVILTPDKYEMWLDNDYNNIKNLSLLLKPFPESKMTFYKVSNKVNSTRYNGPDCIMPAT